MQLCPLLIPPSCPVLLSFVGLLSNAEDLWKPPLPPASQERSCRLPPSFAASESERPSLSFHLKSRRNGQKLQVTATFRSQGWTLCVLCKLGRDERMLAGEVKRGREREGGGERKEGRKEVKAMQPNRLPGRRLESLRFSRTISGEETHNYSSPMYLSTG